MFHNLPVRENSKTIKLLIKLKLLRKTFISLIIFKCLHCSRDLLYILLAKAGYYTIDIPNVQSKNSPKQIYAIVETIGDTLLKL